MSFSQFPWENRVFRVDRECYLLFLGMDELDEKPFVRIGNSSWLDERVLDIISHTVITESFTGNPFSEVGLTHHYHGLYLGEPRIVEVIKSFFNRFKVAEPEVISYSEQEEREGRDHVYFYNTGNIVVTFDKIRLFDLYAREKADRHYNYYCSEILSIFRKNPLKWDSHDLKGQGFFMAGGSLFFYEKGRLLGLKWDKNYFKTLARAGWDPDKLEGILVGLKPEEMEGEKSSGVMNFIKRGISAKNPMTFFSRDKTFSSKIEPLFEYVQSRSVPIKFRDISREGRFDWHSTEGEWNDGTFNFSLTGNVAAGMDEEGRITLNYGGVERECRLLEGVPSRIHTETPDWGEFHKIYVEQVVKMLQKSEMPGRSGQFVHDASQVVTAIYKAVEMGDEFLSVPAEKQFAAFKKNLRLLGKDGDERTVLLAANCASLLELAPGKTGCRDKAVELAAALRKNINPPASQAEGFLYSANYYENSCFYLPCKLNISPGDRAKATEMHEALIQCDKKEVDFFFSERTRLEEIIGSLNDGTLWEEMKKARDEATVMSETKSEPPQKKKEQETNYTEKASESKGAGRGQGRKKRRIWPLLLILLLLLLGVGLLAVDYSRRGDGSVFSRAAKGIIDNGTSKGNGADGTDGGSYQENGSSRGDSTVDDSDSGKNIDGGESDSTVSTGSGDDGGRSDGQVKSTSSPLSDSDSKVIPGEHEGEAAQVVFEDTPETQVTKPFVMDDDFLNDFMIDGILITMADIHLKANDISVMNGYRDLGFHKVQGMDPTIIEPGLVLKIPGNMTYEVRKDDNIWYIAARLLESELRDHSSRFTDLKEAYDQALASGGSGEKEIKEAEKLISASNCENFIKMVENWLENA